MTDRPDLPDLRPTRRSTGIGPCRAIRQVRSGLGEIAIDAPLLDHRVGAGHGPAPTIRRKAAPKQQRQHQAKRPGNHQDDSHGVDAEPRGADVDRKGQDRTDHQQEDADTKAHAPRLLHYASTVGHSPTLVVASSKTLGPWLLLRISSTSGRTSEPGTAGSLQVGATGL